MQSLSSTEIQISFLEVLNEKLRREAADHAPVQARQINYWPMFVVSGLLSFSAWTLSWIS
ncbi:hypothetical protein [Rubinisphaera italica]|uniref:Uncharacterized protein n=1 Tax=Rubinisphaera italica TaxID=2527969 RepID=A0A5C5XAU0_9PLAN|nr:hypothetical protein [Rubinisphaera italica]TWT60146.1 hypothetical protein Pan54_08600 [Rubinisphaera italica]HBN76350.1 hypothetical protein [Planctomycetaceae bacterium]